MTNGLTAVEVALLKLAKLTDEERPEIRIYPPAIDEGDWTVELSERVGTGMSLEDAIAKATGDY